MVLSEDSKKQIIQRIIDGFITIFNVPELSDAIENAMVKEYRKGISDTDEMIDSPVNATPNADTEQRLRNLGSQGLQDFNDEMMDKLKGTLRRGMIEGESSGMMKDSIKDFFSDKPNPTRFDWDTRLDTALRTETNRAYNLGVNDSADQSGLVGLKKYVLIVDDARTSKICHAEHAAYGTEDKAIPRDEEFIVTVDKKTYTKMQPPFHPNCRTKMLISTKEATGNEI